MTNCVGRADDPPGAFILALSAADGQGPRKLSPVLTLNAAMREPSLGSVDVANQVHSLRLAPVVGPSAMATVFPSSIARWMQTYARIGGAPMYSARAVKV